MKTIWKFPLAITDEQHVAMPKGAQLLTVQLQGEIPCIWAIVDPDAISEDRYIKTVDTSQPINEMDAKLPYLGTYQFRGLVLHVFYEVTP